MNIMKKCNYILKYTETHHDINVIYYQTNKQTNKQILYYPQTLHSVQGVNTSNKYFIIPRHYTVYKGSKHQTNT